MAGDAIEQAAKQLGIDPDQLRQMQKQKDRDELKSIFVEALKEVLGDDSEGGEGEGAGGDGGSGEGVGGGEGEGEGAVLSLAKRFLG